MTKKTIYNIELSECCEKFHGDDLPEALEKVQDEINECIKDAVTVAIKGFNISRLDHKPIVASVDDDTFGDHMIGIEFELGESADALYIVDVLKNQQIEITVTEDRKLAVMRFRQ